jgi:mannose-1-phosphate guanylyltransferase
MKIVIFAGGVGTRLWPLSRKRSPKQFEKVVGDKSTLQLTVDRLTPDFKPEDIFISTGRQYREIIERQLPQIPDANIIVEPEMRDVAAAVGLVTSIFMKIGRDEPMAILWGDHIMKDDAKFRRVLKSAERVIVNNPDKVVIIGQKARFANQNLGWMEFGSEVVGEQDGVAYHSLNAFRYRPPLQTAQEWFKDGKHCWNLGYFVVMPGVIWGMYERYASDMFVKLKRIQDAFGTTSYGAVLQSVYPTLQKLHFDNVVPENLQKGQAYVMFEEFGWSDPGAWEALKEALQTHREDNVTKGNLLLEGVKDALIYDYQGKKLVVGIDLEDMLVVNTEDVLVVAKKSSASKIKTIVEGLEKTRYSDLA